MTAAPIRSRSAPRPQASAPAQPSPEGALTYINTKRTAYGSETEHQEVVRTPVFTNTPAKVRVGGSVTKNLGDFNSARVEVSIEMPCLPEQSEVERVYQILSHRVDDMIRTELAIATGEIDPNQQQAPQPQGTHNGIQSPHS